MTVDEALAALADAIGTDPSDVSDAARKLRKAIPDLGQDLLNTGAALKKKDVAAEHKRLSEELEAAKALAEETAREFDAHKAETPNVAAIEAALKAKHQKEIDKLTETVRAKDEKIATKTRAQLRARLVALLVEKHSVNPKWADKVVAADHEDRLVVNADGTSKVLQIGREDAYDADSEDAALTLLAADAAKKVEPDWITSPIGSGGGRSNGVVGGFNTARTEEDLMQQKRATIRPLF